jgi:hypothetical protein
MWPRKFTLRAVFSAFVAVMFTIAAVPGVMAMPAPSLSMSMSMHCAKAASSHCDHMKPQKEQGSPCKSMQVCMGVLGCFGMVAISQECVVPLVASVYEPMPDIGQIPSGLAPPPNDRPPIA